MAKKKSKAKKKKDEGYKSSGNMTADLVALLGKEAAEAFSLAYDGQSVVRVCSVKECTNAGSVVDHNHNWVCNAVNCGQ